MRAVLLLSGGLDSAANLALAREGGFEVAHALTFDYGQRAAAKEREHAAVLAERFSITHSVIDLRSFPLWLGKAGGALLGGADVPHLKENLLDDSATTRESAKAVWVPNRNGVFISIAAAVAEARGLNAVAVGFNAEEAVTFPDNTVEYMNAMTESLRFSTANHVKVVSATAKLNKKQIVEKLNRQGFPLNLIWSCYHGGAEPCGQCESCQRFERAKGNHA